MSEEEAAHLESDEDDSVLDAAALGLAPSPDKEPDKKKTYQANCKIRVEFGDSVRNWQHNNKPDDSKTPAAIRDEWIGIRTTESLSEASLTILPTIAKLTNRNGEVFTGTYAADNSVSNLVDCIAIWNRERECYVLEVINRNIVNLQKAAAERNDPLIDPFAQSRQAEQRLSIKKRKLGSAKARGRSKKR